MLLSLNEMSCFKKKKKVQAHVTDYAPQPEAIKWKINPL